MATKKRAADFDFNSSDPGPATKTARERRHAKAADAEGELLFKRMALWNRQKIEAYVRLHRQNETRAIAAALMSAAEIVRAETARQQTAAARSARSKTMQARVQAAARLYKARLKAHPREGYDMRCEYLREELKPCSRRTIETYIAQARNQGLL